MSDACINCKCESLEDSPLYKIDARLRLDHKTLPTSQSLHTHSYRRLRKKTVIPLSTIYVLFAAVSTLMKLLHSSMLPLCYIPLSYYTVTYFIILSFRFLAHCTHRSRNIQMLFSIPPPYILSGVCMWHRMLYCILFYILMICIYSVRQIHIIWNSIFMNIITHSESVWKPNEWTMFKFYVLQALMSIYREKKVAYKC